MQHLQTVPAAIQPNPIEWLARPGRSICGGPRGVAQLGSASALGAEGRRFKSCHPDQQYRPTRQRDLPEEHDREEHRRAVEPHPGSHQCGGALRRAGARLRPGLQAARPAGPAAWLPARQGAAQAAGGPHRPRRRARAGRQRRAAQPLQRGGDDLRGAPAGPAGHRDHQARRQRRARLHRRGRHPPRHHHSRPRSLENRGRPDRGDRRGHRRRTAVAARPVRHAQGRRAWRRGR